MKTFCFLALTLSCSGATLTLSGTIRDINTPTPPASTFHIEFQDIQLDRDSYFYEIDPINGDFESYSFTFTSITYEVNYFRAGESTQRMILGDSVLTFRIDRVYNADGSIGYDAIDFYDHTPSPGFDLELLDTSYQLFDQVLTTGFFPTSFPLVSSPSYPLFPAGSYIYDAVGVDHFDVESFSISQVGSIIPEPSSTSMMLAGAGLLLTTRRRR